MEHEARIKELTEAYPEVDLTKEPVELLAELAGYWLAQRRRNLYGLEDSFGHVDDDTIAAERYRMQQAKRGARNAVRDIEKIAVARAEKASAISNAVDAAIRREALVLAEFNGVLLIERFALPDGTTVTWGEATVEQHEARIAMLEHDATGIIETAARHRHAVNKIRAIGAVNLDSALIETAA